MPLRYGLGDIGLLREAVIPGAVRHSSCRSADPESRSKNTKCKTAAAMPGFLFGLFLGGDCGPLGHHLIASVPNGLAGKSNNIAGITVIRGGKVWVALTLSTRINEAYDWCG